MSLQVTTAPGALVALGIGAGDVASIISLGRRMGNWWTGASGDTELLRLLDEDAHEILKRRGLLDILAFNKKWRKQIKLLGNGVPLNLKEEDIQNVLKDTEKLLEELPLFTAVMTCLVAVLDSFASRNVVQALLHRVLKALLNPTDNGLEILRSQYNARLNAWRSTACLRGFSDVVENYKSQLVRQGHILPGYMPASETPHMEQFILWLLGTNDSCFETVSSDVAGVAACLCVLGIDILQVEGGGFARTTRSHCNVLYSKEPFLHDSASRARASAALLNRNVMITVPLEDPSESTSIFPITAEARNMCRLAWKEGIRAAAVVAIGVRKSFNESARNINLEEPMAQFTDIQYTIVDGGRPMERTSTQQMNLAKRFGLVLNQELLDGLKNSLHQISADLLSWFGDTTDGHRGSMFGGSGISDPDMTDGSKIVGFCVFQSFFMGYYYDLFGRLVDTSTLVSQTIEGSWGFRSENFLRYIQRVKSELPPGKNTARHITLSRQQVLPILARLFLGNDEHQSFIDDPEQGTTRRCYMGMVGKRTLLVNSLLGKCSSPREIGGFTIVDVDVGGIPRDSEGLICPGVRSDTLDSDFMDPERLNRLIQLNLPEKSPDEDVTFNIEPDWDGNPDTTLVCVRYKGRRVTAMSPLLADWEFCRCYVPLETGNEAPSATGRSRLDHAVEMNISDLIQDDSKLLGSGHPKIPVLFQALDRPCLRYAVTSMNDECKSVKRIAKVRKRRFWDT
ncbi:hypothetical protein FDECE_12653 [Fusarium decemcellulare]|nr:hypothetical protein FDECE_12653 [Fusarium decemcellulare]